MKIKKIYSVFFLALLVRAAYLAYNVSLDIPHVWFETTLFSLRVAEHLMGVPASIDFSLERAILCYNYDFRGMAYIHMLLIWLFGKSSLNTVTYIQAVLDSSMVFFIAALGQRLAGDKLAKLSALIYALFPLAIYMVGTAVWHTWINAGIIVSTWCFVEMVFESMNHSHAASSQRPSKRLLRLAAIAAGIMVIMPHFRVTTIFLYGFLAVWSLLRWKRWNIASHSMRPRISLLGLCCLITALGLASYLGTNLLLTGSRSVGRTSYAHSFLMGVGERTNSYATEHQLDGSDGSVMQYYLRETGDTGNFDALSTTRYKEWTRAKVKEFVQTRPMLYLSLIAKRVMEMFFPNFRLTLVADTEAVAAIESPEKKAQRLAIIHSSLKFKPSMQIKLLQLDPVYFFEFWLRIFSVLALSFGLLLALWFGSAIQRFILFLYLGPLIYFCILLTWIRLPNYDHAGAWSALLPGCVLGWQILYQKIKNNLNHPRQA